MKKIFTQSSSFACYLDFYLHHVHQILKTITSLNTQLREDSQTEDRILPFVVYQHSFVRSISTGCAEFCIRNRADKFAKCHYYIKKNVSRHNGNSCAG